MSNKVWLRNNLTTLRNNVVWQFIHPRLILLFVYWGFVFFFQKIKRCLSLSFNLTKQRKTFHPLSRTFDHKRRVENLLSKQIFLDPKMYLTEECWSLNPVKFFLDSLNSCLHELQLMRFSLGRWSSQFFNFTLWPLLIIFYISQSFLFNFFFLKIKIKWRKVWIVVWKHFFILK